MATKNVGRGALFILVGGIAAVVLATALLNGPPPPAPNPLLGKRVQIAAAAVGCPSETWLNVAVDWRLANPQGRFLSDNLISQGCVWIYAQGEGTVLAVDGSNVHLGKLTDWQGKPFADSQDASNPLTMASDLWVAPDQGSLLMFDWRGSPLN